MSESNRLRLAYIEETTLGTTPAPTTANPVKTMRVTGESLRGNITTGTSDELRADGQISSIFELGRSFAGGINFELSHPLAQSFHRDFLRSAFRNNWTEKANHYNTAAGAPISAVAAGTGVYTVASLGTNYPVGALVYMSGFTNAANNGLFPVTASTGTSVTVTNAASVAETPPVGAQIKFVGMQFASGVVSAAVSPNRLVLSTGSFLTLLPGLAVGDAINIGSSQNAAYGFATAANNQFARVTSITATTIGLDHLPSGWAADAGTGKTLRIWVSDTLSNGTTKISFSVEKSFQDVANAFRVGRGNIVETLSLDITAQQKISGSYSLSGMGFVQNAAQIGTPNPATLEAVQTGSANAGTVFEFGQPVTDPVRSISLNINNNVEPVPTIGTSYPTGQNLGRCIVTGSISIYQQTATRYSRYVSFSDTEIALRTTAAIPTGTPGAATGMRGLFLQIPNVKFGEADDTASGPDQMIMETYSFSAYIDAITGKQILLSSFDYLEL